MLPMALGALGVWIGAKRRPLRVLSEGHCACGRVSDYHGTKVWTPTHTQVGASFGRLRAGEQCKELSVQPTGQPQARPDFRNSI